MKYCKDTHECIKELFLETPEAMKSFIFGLCIACPHGGEYDSSCPMKKIKMACGEEGKSLLDKIDEIPIDEIESMLNYHFDDCPKEG